MMVKDPDGHNVEFVEYMPDSCTQELRKVRARLGSPSGSSTWGHGEGRPQPMGSTATFSVSAISGTAA